MSLQEGENIGNIIAKVQDDLQYLRDAATKGFASDVGSIDLETLDEVITRTEQGVQAVAEKVLHSSQNHITTLPAVARKKETNGKAESDLQTHTRHSRKAQNDKLPDLSAGQFCLVKHMSQLVAQPANPLTHKILANYYDLPSKERAPIVKESIPRQLLVGSTVDHLTTLPKSHRRDPQLTPPPISQNDASKGLLSLLERGLIPPAAEIVLSPPPVNPRSVRLHTPSKQHIPQKIADGTISQLAGVKLDSRPTSVQIPSVPKPAPAQEDYPALHLKTLEIPDLNSDTPSLPPISTTTPTSYKIIIQNGHLVDGTRDFALFKQENQKQWKQILRVLKAVVELCRNYAIPLCIIDSNRLLSLSMEYELGIKSDLLAIMINRKEVQEILSLSGQRYRGQDGRHAAATKIRATYLMFKERKKYLHYRHRKWAAGVLCLAWLTFLKMHVIKERLRHIRLTHLEAHKSQTQYLHKRWAEIQSSKRTIIHMASQGYSQPVRGSIPNFQKEQSLQMGRLCDIQDPNVDVVYVSPTPLGEEVIEYYHRLLAMGPAGESSKHRVHFVSPERLNSFKMHNMALSSLVLYSPVCLSRIKRLIAGREAYIVSGTVTKEDLAIAYELGVPLLGSEPATSQLYSTKAGARRLLRDTDVTVPPYEADIFSQEQLFETLASLIVNNPLISRWMFKLPEQIKGRGFAYCDVVQHLPCYEWLLREVKRYGPKWKKRWAQEPALKKITCLVPKILAEHVQIVDTTLYPGWRDYLKCFLQVGGLIEGIPPSDSITSIAVDIMIEPSGQIKIHFTHDQICSEPYRVWGGSVPQSSVPHSQLMQALDQVATACKARGILGYLSIDFVTFIDPGSMCQMLWCVDLDLCYSNTFALYQLMTYLTGFQFDVTSGTLSTLNNPRYAVLAPHLFHSNLSPLYYSIFFQMCKAHHIGFDPQVQLGTLFNLADNKHREYLGMICVQKTLPKAMQSCSSNLSIIHQEISTPTMQGHSNFKVVMEELDKILELVHSNK